MKKKYKHSSTLLLEIARHKNISGKVTFQYILHALKEQAFGVVLLLFALPNVLPFSAIPGVSVIFNLPIMILASQMMFARKTLWLPKIIAKRKIHHAKISKIIYTTVPYLIKVEHFLKPRWAFMTGPFMLILNGVIIFCLALLLTLPIPLSNFIFALLLITFSLGLIEKDGLFIALGYVATFFYLSFIYPAWRKTSAFRPGM